MALRARNLIVGRTDAGIFVIRVRKIHVRTAILVLVHIGFFFFSFFA